MSFEIWLQVRGAAYELLAALRSLHQSLILAGGGMPTLPTVPSSSQGTSALC